MDPNELRRKKAGLLAQAEGIDSELTAEDCDLNAEQRQKRESKVEDLLAEAEQCEAEAKAIEAREQESRDRRKRMEALAQEGATRNRGGERQAQGEPGIGADGGDPNIEVKDPEWTHDPMKGFKSPSDFFGAVMKAPPDPYSASDPRLQYLAAAGTDEQQSGSDPYGGFLVPEGMSPTLLQVGPEMDPFAGRTTNLPMGTPSVDINARVDKDHSTSVSGGLSVSRSSETAAKTASRMKLEQITLKANSLWGFGHATEELLRDSPQSVAALLEAGFRDEFVNTGIQEKLRGTGVGEPEGILNNPALITVAKEGSQSADTIVGQNILKMRSRCWRYSQAIWLANHDTLPQLATVHIAGTNGDVFLYAPGNGTDVPDTLFGRPIFYTEYAETLGDKGDIMLVVPSEILEGTYQPLESAESIHVRFDRGERSFRFSLRNDSRGWWRSALTPNKSSSTLSPFVTLAARG